MTLCELATAKHLSPPLECAPFSSENTPLYSQEHDDTAGKVRRVSRHFSVRVMKHAQAAYDLEHYLGAHNSGLATLDI